MANDRIGMVVRYIHRMAVPHVGREWTDRQLLNNFLLDKDPTAREISAAGVSSAKAVALAEGVLKSMCVAKLKIATGLLLAAGLCGAAGGTLAYQNQDSTKPAPQQSSTAKGHGAYAVQSHKEKPTEIERQKALADFAQRYALKPDEIVKRVPTPFPPSRLVYHRQYYPKDDRAEDMMFMKWDNGLHFVGTIGGMKSDLRKVQLLFLFGYLPMMRGDYGAGPRLDVRGDADLLAAAVDGDFVFPTDRFLHGGGKERVSARDSRCLSVLDTLSLLQPALYAFAVAPASKERNAWIVSEWLLRLC
jgi:hypothetical protein